MHDRRIDGETHLFGNAGALFMNAMTWWDHTTRSIWSQPWGRAITGDYKGVELFLLPSQVTTWSAWKDEHPQTRAMVNDVDRLGARRQEFSEDFVIGLLLDGHAKAYAYTDVAATGIVNDEFGGFPVLLWAADANFHAYLRQVGTQVLAFDLRDGALVDRQTGSTWDVTRGLATAGPLAGESLQPVPGSTSYDWAWFDFYPDSERYAPGS